MTARVYSESTAGSVQVLSVSRMVGPVEALFVEHGVEAAAEQHAGLLILDLESPGGYRSAVDSVAAAVRSSPVPTVVYLHPGGTAVPESLLPVLKAGTLSATLPGGALSADLSAPNLHDLLTRISQGVSLPSGGTIRASTTSVHISAMGPLLELLSGFVRPDIAYVLFLLGLVGLLVEIATPGIGVPGVAGALCVLVSVASFSLLSVNPLGLILMVAAFALFVFEIKIPTHGILSLFGIGGIIAGSVMLFPSAPGASSVPTFHVSTVTVVAATAVLAAAIMLIVMKGVGAQRREITTGSTSLVGRQGLSVNEFGPPDGSVEMLPAVGIVRVNGEEWSATSMGETIRAGDEIVVVAAEGIHLVVVKRN
ncbi:NfeD family protein [Salinispira pacifica]